jgi:hypothetical protein
MQTLKGIGFLSEAAAQRRAYIEDKGHIDEKWRQGVHLRRAYCALADSVSARMGLPLSWQRRPGDSDIDEDREFLRAAFDLPAPVLP